MKYTLENATIYFLLIVVKNSKCALIIFFLFDLFNLIFNFITKTAISNFGNSITIS